MCVLWVESVLELSSDEMSGVVTTLFGRRSVKFRVAHMLFIWLVTPNSLCSWLLFNIDPPHRSLPQLQGKNMKGEGIDSHRESDEVIGASDGMADGFSHGDKSCRKNCRVVSDDQIGAPDDAGDDSPSKDKPLSRLLLRGLMPFSFRPLSYLSSVSKTCI